VTPYEEFLRSKVVIAADRGLDAPCELSPHLKPHQADICRWAIRGGARGIFCSFGLGKTHIQIQILQAILEKFGGAGLIVCPLGVKGEFVRDAREYFGLEFVYVRTDAEYTEQFTAGYRFFLTNYERVRDGDLNPNRFCVVSLDEASVLRSFGSKTYQTFLGLFDTVRFKYVCTATPSPNRFKELIHYAGFLGVMDTGQALTRFFKRDSTQAGNLQLHPHKEREFWLWVSTWATFLTKPSDLGYSDDGYELPPLAIHRHRLPVDHGTAGFDSWGQGKLLRDAALGVQDASRERRDSLDDRIAKAKEIIDAGEPDRHWIIWHDLEDERRAIEKAFAAYDIRTVYGSQDLDEREQAIADFSDGRFRILGTKPILSGSGCNFQRHCHSAIYLGVGYKFNDFIQSCHRIQRFLQTHPVDIHLIYTESEDAIYDTLMAKWAQHRELVAQMTDIIHEHGLNNAKLGSEMQRAIGIERREVRGELYTAVNNDNVLELGRMADSSVDLIVTSWPFSDHYEYTESYNDFGHNDGDDGFFAQMEFLTPETMRVLKPGRMYCVHAKDRIQYGSVTGDGMYTVNPFSDKCVAHMQKHGFRYCGRVTVVTDVVRENNQTYRLGWSEQCKDGTKMGVGSSEYVLLFRKLPTDTVNAYADVPVVKSKAEYTRARWQFDAHGFWRSSGNRFLRPEEIRELPLEQLRALWHEFNLKHVYEFEEHVGIAQSLEDAGCLPSSFMALDPKSHSSWVWDDVTRMRTLNTDQSRNRLEQHVCPLQFDIVDRLIVRYSNTGDLVLDPFGGIGTVAYRAVLLGRRGYSVELSTEYWLDSVGYCRAAEQKVGMPSLFDVLNTPDQLSEVAL
jgi:DNA modification methylase